MQHHFHSPSMETLAGGKVEGEGVVHSSIEISFIENVLPPPTESSSLQRHPPSKLFQPTSSPRRPVLPHYNPTSSPHRRPPDPALCPTSSPLTEATMAELVVTFGRLGHSPSQAQLGALQEAVGIA